MISAVIHSPQTRYPTWGLTHSLRVLSALNQHAAFRKFPPTLKSSATPSRTYTTTCVLTLALPAEVAEVHVFFANEPRHYKYMLDSPLACSCFLQSIPKAIYDLIYVTSRSLDNRNAHMPEPRYRDEKVIRRERKYNSHPIRK